MSQHCPNPWEWLDITAWNHDDVKFSRCIESWSGPESRLAIMPIAEAADEFNVLQRWNALVPNGQPGYCKDCKKWESCDRPVIEAPPPDSYPRYPTVLNLAYDRSCNLRCPTCRKEHFCYQPWEGECETLLRFQDNVIRPLLKTARRAYLAGLGDPFASPCYSELLRTTQPSDAPDLKWAITTNGQLFTLERYEAIPTRKQIDTVHVSIDSANSAFYHENRRSSWRNLMKNLQFLSNLRREGSIKTLEISMVVQENNYRDMTAFVDLAKMHYVDNVKFAALLAQGTFLDSEYLRRAVHLPNHPEHKDALQSMSYAMARGKEIGINVTVEMPR